MPSTDTIITTKMEILSNIRDLIESDRESAFFDAKEVKDIIEYIYGPQDFTGAGSASNLFAQFIEGWEDQITSGCHPNVANCVTIWNLMVENTVWEDEDESNEELCDECCDSSFEDESEELCNDSGKLTLIQFIQGISSSVADHITSIRKDENTFIITVR